MRYVAGVIFFCFGFFGFLIYLCPPFIKNKIIFLMSRCWFYVLRFRVRIALLNLSLVFPRHDEESMGDYQKRIETLAIKNLEHTALSLLEIFERIHWTPQNRVPDKLEIIGMEHVQSLIDKKEGFFFLSSHLGNWEVMTQAGCFYKIPLVIVTKYLRNAFFDKMWVQSRVRYGLELLEEKGSGLSVVKAIRSGKSLGFILDQHTGEPHGMESIFLGQKAWCPKGLSILSHRLGAKVFPAFIVRESSGKLCVFIEPALQFAELKHINSRVTLNSDQILYHLGICNKKMEEWILKYPEQYLWIHKRFKNILDYNKKSLPWEL